MCKTLLPTAADQGFTIDDVAVNDITLLEVLDLDQFLEAGGLNDPQVAGFILLHLDPKKIRLVAGGESRGFNVFRSKKEEYGKMLDPPQTDPQYKEASGRPQTDPQYNEASDRRQTDPQQEVPPKILEVIAMPTVSIVRGSDCTCTHGGSVVSICSS